MLTVHYGPFQPALESAFLKELESLKRRDPLAPVAVVAPSGRLARRLQRLVALESEQTYLAVRFHTFFSLAKEIVGEAADSARLVGDPMFFERLIDEILKEEGGAWKSARPRGLAGSLRSSLKDLIDSGVESRAVELLEQGLLKDPEESRRLARLLGLLALYENKIEGLGLLTPAALTRKAADLAPGAASLKRWQVRSSRR